MPNFSLPDSVFEKACDSFPTPFHLYDEAGIRRNARALNEAFAWCADFKEYFAVKALPNPAILRVLREEGCGVDCSSETELMLADACGFSGGEIMFSANAMPYEEFDHARQMGAQPPGALAQGLRMGIHPAHAIQALFRAHQAVGDAAVVLAHHMHRMFRKQITVLPHCAVQAVLQGDKAQIAAAGGHFAEHGVKIVHGAHIGAVPQAFQRGHVGKGALRPQKGHPQRLLQRP